jgi:adenosylmethionine-8-amino-7-oxononanoate aminotransferase
MTLTERDQNILHPYTQHKTAAVPIAIKRGKGVYFGTKMIQRIHRCHCLMVGNPYGHSNTFIADAIYKQLTTLNMFFGGFTHEPAIVLGEKLRFQAKTNKSILSDNGSTAVEVGIKVALQYFFNKGEQRTTIIAFENAFHEDTLQRWLPAEFHFTQAFEGMFIDVVRIPVSRKRGRKLPLYASK